MLVLINAYCHNKRKHKLYKYLTYRNVILNIYFVKFLFMQQFLDILQLLKQSNILE